MKISDERLDDIRGHNAAMLAWPGVDEKVRSRSAEMVSMCNELQQHRDEKSWVPISNLNETTAPQFFQLSDGKSVNPMPFWLRDGVLCTWAEDQDDIGDVSIAMAQEWYTHFRPLPMD